MLQEAHVTELVIGAFYRVYKSLGYGFLESVYSKALGIEFETKRVAFAREVSLEVRYKGEVVGAYRADLIVADRVLVEIKSTKTLTDADTRQVLNYLKATHLEVALLLHFGPGPKFHRFIYTNDCK